MRLLPCHYYQVSDPDSIFFEMLFYSHSITVEYHGFSEFLNPLVIVKGSLAVVDEPVCFSSMQLSPWLKKTSLFQQLRWNFDVLCKRRDEAILSMNSPVTVTAKNSPVSVRVIDPEGVF